MFCLHPSVACTTFVNVCTRNDLKKSAESPFSIFPLVILLFLRGDLRRLFSNCGLNLQTNHDCGLAIGDIAIECFGVHAIESLDVRVHVATKFVKMMKRKKVAINRFSNFDTSIFNSARNASSNGLCFDLSFFEV